MPTNRNRRQRKNNKLIVPPALFRYFETGNDDQSGFDECDQFNPFIIFETGNGQDLSDYWELCREELLADWIKKNPCNRPWAFWALDAAGFGGVFCCFKVPSEVDQLKYLIDHGLLTAAEIKYLEKHPELNELDLL